MVQPVSYPIGHVEVLPEVKNSAEHPGVAKAIYVAPSWGPVENQRRKVIGERLTTPLPADGSSIRYYALKGFRPATRADLERLNPNAFQHNSEEEAVSPSDAPSGE